jgi:histidyl-tRNA synthetase
MWRQKSSHIIMNNHLELNKETEAEKAAKKAIEKVAIKDSMRAFISYEHLDRIGEIALHYGFQPRQSPAITKADIEHAKSLLDGDSIDDAEEGKQRLPLHVEEKTALLRMYEEGAMHNHSQPVMFYFKEPFRGSLKKGTYPRYADLEIIGQSGSIAEAALIQTARAILAEEGYVNIKVEINSIGDKDSIARFTRELTAYYRKHVNEMHPDCRQLFKQDPFDLLTAHNEACKSLNEHAPKAMDFLSEQSRSHFQEVLEYLEALGIPYEINNRLIGNRKYCTETVFAIIDADHGAKKTKADHRILAIGVRYDGLARKVGGKRDLQGVGMSILIKGNRTELRKEVKRAKRPFASFVQLGFESKLLSLIVIESLRMAKIPLHLSLAKDRLGAQVSSVERYHVAYSIIIGKKEAVERTAIVRDNATHAQVIVSLDDLPNHMKKAEKKLGR